MAKRLPGIVFPRIKSRPGFFGSHNDFLHSLYADNPHKQRLSSLKKSDVDTKFEEALCQQLGKDTRALHSILQREV